MMDILSDIVIAICLLVLFSAILINFFESKKNVQKAKKSIVETGSMTGFFLVFYVLIRFKIGHLEINEGVLSIIKPVGLVMIIVGTYINIHGRRVLGMNWANQVTIYNDQKLVRNGIYKYIRHPLYSSIILMFFGACLVYPNYLAFLSNTIVFIPFMYYRAKQEENLLKEKFPPALPCNT